nr:pentatricopeptide repeat-containing protein [Ipomoea batatas]
MAHVSNIKLIRTDTTLDLSQKAEKDIKLIRTDTTLDLSQKAEKGKTEKEYELVLSPLPGKKMFVINNGLCCNAIMTNFRICDSSMTSNAHKISLPFLISSSDHTLYN